MVVTVLALAVIGALYFRGLQQPLHDLHTLTLPSVPTPVAAPSADEPATIAEPAVVNPIEQSEAGRQPAAGRRAVHCQRCRRPRADGAEL